MSTSLIKKFCDNNVSCIPTIYALSVRWATKPRWLPIAKTKRFRVAKPPVLRPLENPEIERLKKLYKTQLKTVINFLKEMHMQNETSVDVIAKYEEDKETAWLKCLTLNDEWNRQVAVEREEYTALMFEKSVEEAKEKKKIEEEKERTQQENIEKLIRQQKELSHTFITKENIDTHINKILNSEPFSFNYAVDLQGNVYEGFNSNPTPDKTLVGKINEELA